MIKNNAKKKKHSFYDLIVKVASLLSSKERLLFSSILRKFRHSVFMEENAFVNNPGFNNAEIKIIAEETRKYLVKYNHLTDPE